MKKGGWILLKKKKKCVVHQGLSSNRTSDCNVTPDLSSSIQNNSLASPVHPPIPTVSYEQLKEIIEHNTALIIDVRTKNELAETGVIPNSLNIPSTFVMLFRLRFNAGAFLPNYIVILFV